MPVTGPDFVSLQVRDLAASQAFYERYLGLVRSPSGPPHAVVFQTSPIAFARATSCPARTRSRGAPRRGDGGLAARHRRPGGPRRARHRRAHRRRGPVDGPFGRTFTFADPTATGSRCTTGADRCQDGPVRHVSDDERRARLAVRHAPRPRPPRRDPGGGHPRRRGAARDGTGHRAPVVLGAGPGVRGRGPRRCPGRSTGPSSSSRLRRTLFVVPQDLLPAVLAQRVGARRGHRARGDGQGGGEVRGRRRARLDRRGAAPRSSRCWRSTRRG